MIRLTNQDYGRLKRTIEKVEFKEYELINYRGLDILLFPCEQTRIEQQRGVPPIFFKISDLANYDIYFGMNVVPVDFRKPCLLHEVVEIGLVEELKTKKGITNEQMWTMAHQVARKYDLKYAREELSDERYSIYSGLQKMLRRKNLPQLIN